MPSAKRPTPIQCLPRHLSSRTPATSGYSVLSQADVRFLVEPQRQEFETLWSEEWDILFFAGHSYSQGDGDCGYIYINQTEKLAISELKNTLKRAIKKGLQLAIFNSCDGLGLANELQRLNIPQMIVMPFKSGEYPLTRNLFVMIKDFPGENNAQEQAGRAYTNLILTGKGQGMVQEPGFVPVAQACPSP